MNVDGTFVVSAPQDRVWRLITDPDVVGRCIPGCREIQVTGPNTYAAEVQVKVGPIKAEFKLEVEVTEEASPDYVISVTRGEEGSRASLISAKNELRLSRYEEGGTEVCYSSEVSITGRLGKYGQGVMKKIAGTLAKKFAANFRERAELVEA